MAQRPIRPVPLAAGVMTSRPYTQRVQVGALYTEGQDRSSRSTRSASVAPINDDMRERTLGIDPFRARFWLVRVPDAARFDSPGCQMCGAPEDEPCECHDPQGDDR